MTPEQKITILETAIKKALADSESGEGKWGPDVTVCAYLQAALDEVADPKPPVVTTDVSPETLAAIECAKRDEAVLKEVNAAVDKALPYGALMRPAPLAMFNEALSQIRTSLALCAHNIRVSEFTIRYGTVAPIGVQTTVTYNASPSEERNTEAVFLVSVIAEDT